jgi:adenylosuccinate synthase
LIKEYYKYNLNLDDFISSINQIIESKNIKLVSNIPNNYEYIFEGSQGLLLDQNIGFFPHVTRSNTGSKNIIEMGFEPELFLVTRAYQTRHGNGKMTNADISNTIISDVNETNITNKYQGVFKRSILDLDLLEYGINKDEYIRNNKNKSLVITCLDHLNDYKFTSKGKLHSFNNESEFVYNIGYMLNISNIYLSKSYESKNIIKFP